MYEVGFRDLLNNPKVSSWFSVEDIVDLQIQRGSNNKNAGKKIFTKDSEKWLNDQSLNLMNKATTYYSTHFVMEIVNLVPLVVSSENLVFSPEALRAEIVSYLEANLMIPMALLWIFVSMFHSATT